MGSSFIKNFLRQYCLCLYIHACIFKLILSTYSCHQCNGPSLIFQVEFYVTHSYLSFSGEFDIVQMLHYPPRTFSLQSQVSASAGSSNNNILQRGLRTRVLTNQLTNKLPFTRIPSSGYYFVVNSK